MVTPLKKRGNLTANSGERRPSLRRDAPGEEIPHEGGDLVAVRLEGEVPGVEEMELQILHVAPVRLGAPGRENLVVPTPHDQHRRLAPAEVLLPLRVERRIAAVAQEQVELDLVVP